MKPIKLGSDHPPMGWLAKLIVLGFLFLATRFLLYECEIGSKSLGATIVIIIYVIGYTIVFFWMNRKKPKNG